MTESENDRRRTILLYAQDGKGMGHITRSVTIVRHLLAAYPDVVAYIATESPIINEFSLPERCDYLKLPSRLAPVEALEIEEEDAARDHFRNVRSEILRVAALGLAPDLVLVDHEPLGRKGEFRDALFALKKESPATKFVFGMRDIMDGVGRIRGQWQELGVYGALEDLYDGIAVYGSRDLFDVAEAYAIPSSVRTKLHYCGYIVRETESADPHAVREQYQLPPSGPLVVATVGGGSDGYAVLEAAQAAVLRLQANHPDLTAILVTGPLMPAEHVQRLVGQATPKCRVVSRADNFQLMAVADAVVSMGGYNSVCEALVAGKPLVIVPRSTHKIEQQIRAETLASRGLARYVHPKELSGEKLASALEWALSRDRQAHSALVRELILSFDGATRLTEYLGRWLGQGRVRVSHPAEEISSMEQSA